MKKSLKNLVWMSVPILLVAGCAENQRDASVSYSPGLTEPMAPTSDRAAARAYPDNVAGGTNPTKAPPGAKSADWTVAEEVRSLLMADRKLGNAGMAAVVNDGVVTLRGGVRNADERQKICDEISKLPGVTRVDDKMDLKNPFGTQPGETQNY